MKLNRRQSLFTFLAGGSLLAWGVRGRSAVGETIQATAVLRRTHPLISAVADTLMSGDGAIAPGSQDLGALILNIAASSMAADKQVSLAAGLDAFWHIADRAVPGGFVAGSPENRLEWLKTYDSAAYFQSSSTLAAHQKAYRFVKGMSVFGYLTSEAGAEALLNIDPVPGPFRGNVDISQSPRTSYVDADALSKIRGLLENCV